MDVTVMSDSVKVTRLPACDMCKDGTLAAYDAKTYLGPWANMCGPHFNMYAADNTKLGTGRGQKLILEEGKGE